VAVEVVSLAEGLSTRVADVGFDVIVNRVYVGIEVTFGGEGHLEQFVIGTKVTL